MESSLQMDLQKTIDDDDKRLTTNKKYFSYLPVTMCTVSNGRWWFQLSLPMFLAYYEKRELLHYKRLSVGFNDERAGKVFPNPVVTNPEMF